MYRIILSVLLFSSVLSAQETVTSSAVYKDNHYSIGINSFFFQEPAMVSFKKWGDNNKGHQLIIGDDPAFAGNRDRQQANGPSDEVFEAQIPSIEYDFLKRTGFLTSNEAYLYTGWGLCIGGHYKYLDEVGAKSGDLFANLRFPVGIEHFFLKSMPFISYTVEADFYVGYWKTCYDTGAPDNIAIRFNTGVTPRFMVNWYFK